jgi:hypothetical protein
MCVPHLNATADKECSAAVSGYAGFMTGLFQQGVAPMLILSISRRPNLAGMSNAATGEDSAGGTT